MKKHYWNYSEETLRNTRLDDIFTPLKTVKYYINGYTEEVAKTEVEKIQNLKPNNIIQATFFYSLLRTQASYPTKQSYKDKFLILEWEAVIKKFKQSLFINKDQKITVKVYLNNIGTKDDNGHFYLIHDAFKKDFSYMELLIDGKSVFSAPVETSHESLRENYRNYIDDYSYWPSIPAWMKLVEYLSLYKYVSNVNEYNKYIEMEIRKVAKPTNNINGYFFIDEKFKKKYGLEKYYK